MIALRRAIFVLIVLGVSLHVVYAQPTPVDVGMIIDGELDPTTPQLYSLTALESSVVSLSVRVTGGTLDPIVRILDSSGRLIVENDDFNYPDTSRAILQSLVMPKTDTYTIEVSAFGDTSGRYELSIQRGYDQLEIHDVDVAVTDWRADGTQDMTTAPVNEKLYVEMTGIAQTGTLLAEHFPVVQDFYYEATLRDILSTSSWQIGVVFRYIDPTSYYRVMFSDQGYWQLEHVSEDVVTVVQDWRTHPAIVAGVADFTLGVMVNGASIHVVYNGQIVGTVYDDTVTDAGRVGVTAITPDAFSSRVTFILDSVLMTTPSLVDDRLQFPMRLVGQNLNAYTALLERQQVVPIGGELALTAPSTTIRNVEAGVSRFPIASTVAFREFIMSGDLTVSTLTDGIGGCGFTFNETADNVYTLVYINQANEYGVSQRDGDTFDAGMYGTLSSTQDAQTRKVTIVVLADVIYLYIDALFVDKMPYTASSGELGTAVVNFDAVDTTCTSDNLWLWSLDG
jgi:hypothetical protein